MRLVALIGLALLALARPAHACGYWSMTDSERGVTVGWLINAASIEKADKRLGAIYLDLDNPSGLRSAAGKTVVFDIKGTALRKRGAKIGTVDATGVTISGTHFAIELADTPDQHDMPTYTLRVTRGDKEIITSAAASSLCAGIKKNMTDEQSREEVRRRVIFYLAWRATGN